MLTALVRSPRARRRVDEANATAAAAGGSAVELGAVLAAVAKADAGAAVMQSVDAMTMALQCAAVRARVCVCGRARAV